MTASNSRSLDWSFFREKVFLNDFNSYENFLFPSAKEKEKSDRYEKFIKRSKEGGNIQGFYMPCGNPTSAKEFALNHYVYWNCLGYLSMKIKMQVIFDYNTDQRIYFGPGQCWACEYSNFIRKYKENKPCTCGYCPLWLNAEKPNGETCLTFGSIYSRWIYNNEDVEKEIARMIWHNYDYLIPEDILNILNREA